jgi:hypothetical protein
LNIPKFLAIAYLFTLFCRITSSLPPRTVLITPAQAETAAISPARPPKIAQDTTSNPQGSNDAWAGYALLKHIASCESWGDPNKEPRQFLPDGSVLHGFPNPNDIGLAQINAPIWQAKAESLGFDIFTYAGNLKMAKWIFDNYGSQPWYWSEGCWGKYQ